MNLIVGRAVVTMNELSSLQRRLDYVDEMHLVHDTVKNLRRSIGTRYCDEHANFDDDTSSVRSSKVSVGTILSPADTENPGTSLRFIFPFL